IDECKEQSGLCQPGGRCINTVGSFVCRCATGFRATPDGHCVDIDECAKSPCSQICTNLPGSYSCSCYRGYTLLPGPGPGVCENLNECELHTDGCSHLCSNTDGSFVCRCPAPLQLAEDGRTCVTNNKRHRKSPITLVSQHNVEAPIHLVSQNKPESRGAREGRNYCQFPCLNGGSCKQGFCHCPPGLTGRVCENDIDECSVLPYELQCTHQCTNTFGSFQCECRSGWSLGADRRTCSPQSCVPACMGGGTCINSVCHCPPGLTGPACGVDVDECASNPCEQLCRNTLGSFACLCRGRTRLAPDGRSCLEPPCVPHCRNGGVCRSGSCVCKPGFHGRLCQLDVNECASQNSPCKHACINSFGSYQCLCPPGLRLSANRTICENDPLNDDQPGDMEHVDVMIEIVVEDQYSRMTYHTMETKAVHLPYWIPTSYPPKPNLHYQLISPTQLTIMNLKTENYDLKSNVIDAVSKSSQISVLQNVLSSDKYKQPLIEDIDHNSYDHHIKRSKSVHLISNPSIIVSPTPAMFLEVKNKATTSLLPSDEWILRSEELSPSVFDSVKTTPLSMTSLGNLPNHYFRNEVKVVSPDSIAINATPSLSVVSSILNSVDLFKSLERAAEESLIELQNNLTVDEDNVDKPADKIFTDENISEQDVNEYDENVEISVNSSENIDFIDHTPSSNFTILPTVLEDVDLIREIANSLFPSYSSINKKTEDQNSTISVHSNTLLFVSSSMFEPETSPSPSSFSISTPVLPSLSDEYIEVASTIFQFVSPSPIVHSQSVLLSSFNDSSIQQQKRKKLKKKKKPKQRKGGKFGQDLQILNQILQTFDLQAATPGDLKKYEVIDLDEVAPSSVNFVVGPSSSSLPVPSDSLPVLQVNSSNRRETDCYYQKKKYKSRTSFFRDEKNCTKCVCKDGELRCTPRHCPPPHCESPIKGDCCDYCPGDCVFEQQVYLPGEKFSPYLDPCRECKCDAGRVVCQDVTCPALACPPQYRAQLPEECCPVCVPPEPGCFWNGRFFYTGQLWVHRQGGCQACLCKKKDEVQCNPVVCVVSCQHPQFVPGDCCPLCEGCQHHGQQYEHEQTFLHPSDPCSTCQCLAGEVSCQATDCLPSCKLDGGRLVPSGTQFSIGSDPCNRCHCVEGQVECRAEVCPVHCTHGVLLSGACCLDCSSCEYKGRLYRDLKVFRSPDDPCLSCLCARGNVLCDNSCEADASNESEEDEDDEQDDERTNE
ncbi:hypothetical protein B566_EDAN006086, partial [Ephemera danica]